MPEYSNETVHLGILFMFILFIEFFRFNQIYLILPLDYKGNNKKFRNDATTKQNSIEVL